MILDKADDLKRVSKLYNLASRRLIAAIKKLSKGALEEKVWTDIIVYNTFLKDQLKSEADEVNHILNILREDNRDNNI